MLTKIDYIQTLAPIVAKTLRATPPEDREATLTSILDILQRTNSKFDPVKFRTELFKHQI